MHRRKRNLAIFSVLLALLIAFPCWLVYRQYEQERKDRALIGAIKKNDPVVVAECLSQGANANARDRPQDRRLSWKSLLDRLLHPDSLSSGLPTALSVAVDQEQENARVIGLLLEHGADPRLRFEGVTPLFTALQNGRLDLVKLLVDYHADVNVGTEDGTTALMYAATFYGPKEIDLLVNDGVNLNAQDSEGNTALTCAIYRGEEENVKHLLSLHADPNVADRTGRSPLSVAESNLASHVHTPNHAEDVDEWRPIINMLRRSGAKR